MQDDLLTAQDLAHFRLGTARPEEGCTAPVTRGIHASTWNNFSIGNSNASEWVRAHARTIFFVALLLMVFVGWKALNTLTLIANADEMTHHTYLVVEKVDRVVSLLKDVESWQHQYVGSGDQRNLAQLREAPSRLDGILVEIDTLVVDPAQRQRFLAIAALSRQLGHEVQARATEMLSRQAGRSGNGIDALRDDFASDDGRALAANIYRMSGEFRATEERMMQERHTHERAASRQARAWFTIGFGLSVLLLWSLVSSLRIEVVKRTLAEADLQSQRDHLENEVANRTGNLSQANERLQQEVGRRQQVEEDLRALTHRLEVLVSERTAELATTLANLKLETAGRIEAIEETRCKERLLIQQSRMAALGEMIGNIAHQWRQPLNVLSLLIQEPPLMYGCGRVDEAYLTENSKKAMQLISHMSQTIEDFRGFFRQDKEKTFFRVKDVIDKALTIMEGNLLSIDVEVDVRDDVIASGYPNELAQALLNIVGNARDALVANTTENPQIRILVTRSGNRAVVKILDNGGGVPENIIDKIFDPYFTTKGPQSGTGIGLFMCKTIVEQNMGGQLSVRNHDGGAEFTIEI